MKEGKCAQFMRPIGHIRRRNVPTNCVISHSDEPNIFQESSVDECTHYRTQFSRKESCQGTEKQAPSSPSRRNKPHPVEVCHLQRLRSGIVCDVRSKSPATSLEKDILGMTRTSSSKDSTSWTKTVYKAHDREHLANQSPCSNSQYPAIGILPQCELKNCSKAGDSNIDHWLPGMHGFKNNSCFSVYFANGNCGYCVQCLGAL